MPASASKLDRPRPHRSARCDSDTQIIHNMYLYSIYFVYTRFRSNSTSNHTHTYIYIYVWIPSPFSVHSVSLQHLHLALRRVPQPCEHLLLAHRPDHFEEARRGSRARERRSHRLREGAQLHLLGGHQTFDVGLESLRVPLPRVLPEPLLSLNRAAPGISTSSAMLFRC